MYIKNKKKFKLVKFILLKVSRLFQFISRFRKAEKRILLVKIDAIGDYVLFRNFLEVLKTSEKYRDYEIELLGNESWKDLAIEYDRGTVSKFHFTNEDTLYERPRAVFKIGWNLFKRRYALILQPTYSRTLMGNGLAALAAGKESIAYLSDAEHHPKYKKKTDKLYTKLLTLPQSIYHEFERNHYFFQEVTGQNSTSLITLSIPFKKTPKRGILIFPGSSWVKKNWEREKFLEIIKLLLAHCNDPIILGGGPSEIPVSCFLLGRLPATERIVDMTGKNSLPEFTQLVASSRLVVSNDTNTVHIAAACRTPVICLLGGGHFGRFMPYSDRMPFKPITIYEEMPCYNCSWNCKYYEDNENPYPCISRISVDRVWEEVQISLKANP